jgi:N,N'-diacetyllegionaminate synthase
MKKMLCIGDKKISSAHSVFIIAEAGVNHNGDINLAKQLIKKAKECGADCIKFQTFKAKQVATINAAKASYQLKTTDPKESQIEMLEKLELPAESYLELIQFSKEQGIIFLSTPYNEEDIDFLDDLGVQAFKLASMHAVEPKIIKHVASKGKPMILSTGMATLGEVDEAVKLFREAGNEQLVLLQCTTNYPSRLEDANLLSMQTMQNAFDVLVGYSDHTEDDTACIMSVALGASVIEKHLTLNKNLPGPDQSTSYEPLEFNRLVKSIRNAEKVLGSARKEPCEIEKINASGMRRSLVSRKNIPAGTEITENMLAFKRPATGLSPKFYDYVVGKKTKKEILADCQIKLSDIE